MLLSMFSCVTQSGQASKETGLSYSMRDDRNRVEDIRSAAKAAIDYLGSVSNDAQRSSNLLIDAVFFHVIVIGEAVRALLEMQAEASSRTQESIISINPQIPWKD
jgi:uncharacterized protein with HEPN domain